MYGTIRRCKKNRRDRLSGLSDHLVLEIMSVLPLKSAVATCVLSHRWRFLWRDLPSINVCVDTDFSKRNQKNEFVTILDNLLANRNSPFIHRFSLDAGYFIDHVDHNLFCIMKRQLSTITSWFDDCTRNHVREFSFKLKDLVSGRLIPCVFPDPPLCLFQTPSLVVLQLSPMFFVHQDYRLFINAVLHLPNLKKLTVQLFPWIPRVLEKIVASSPSLEYLSFHVIPEQPHRYRAPIDDIHDYNTVNLSSQSLKQLDMELDRTMVVVLDTPKLDYLSFRVEHLDQTSSYRVSFVNSPPSLLCCSIWASWHTLHDIFQPCNLFRLVSNVISLTINDNKPDPLIAPLIFGRLTHLTLRLCSADEALFSGLALLQQCPLLEVLTLDLSKSINLLGRTWSSPNPTPQCLVTCIKTIQIIARPFVDKLVTSLLLLLNYLLGTAQALQLLRINITAPKYESDISAYNELQLIKKVFQVPRSSPLCPIEFNGRHQRILARGIDEATSMGSRLR